MIYLDHAATSPMTRPVIEAMWPYLTDAFANASSVHEMGKLAAAGLHAARTQVATVFGGSAGEITFTSGGTESDNLALKGIALTHPGPKRIVTSPIEHEAVLETCSYLERHHGFTTRFVKVDGEGFVDLDDLRKLVAEGATVCSIQYANNEVGTVQPIADIGDLCRAHDVPLHVDAVQAAGLLPLDIPSDLISISAHKFGGPKGVGALFVRSGWTLEPLVHGGGQERGLRSGTSNVAGAVGLATALDLAEQRGVENVARLTEMRDRLIDGVVSVDPTAVLTGPRHRRLPGHVSFCFPGISGESVLVELEMQGIACSSGSACAAGHDEPSYVLRALGISDELAQSAVRFTLGLETTSEDIDATIRALGHTVERLRSR